MRRRQRLCHHAANTRSAVRHLRHGAGLLGRLSPRDRYRCRLFSVLQRIPQADQSPRVLRLLGKCYGQHRDGRLSIRDPCGIVVSSMPVSRFLNPVVRTFILVPAQRQSYKTLMRIGSCPPMHYGPSRWPVTSISPSSVNTTPISCESKNGNTFCSATDCRLSRLLSTSLSGAGPAAGSTVPPW